MNQISLLVVIVYIFLSKLLYCAPYRKWVFLCVWFINKTYWRLSPKQVHIFHLLYCSSLDYGVSMFLSSCKCKKTPRRLNWMWIIRHLSCWSSIFTVVSCLSEHSWNVNIHLDTTKYTSIPSKRAFVYWLAEGSEYMPYLENTSHIYKCSTKETNWSDFC